MYKIFSFVLLSLIVIFTTNDSIANDEVNTKAIAKEGFGGVSEIYNQMSPKQKEDVYNKAMSMMEEIKDMSPSEIKSLKKQLREMHNSFDFQNVNVNKIDTEKDLDFKKIQKDLKKYNK